MRACAVNIKYSLDHLLVLVKFAYNNSYQDSIQMTSCKATWKLEDKKEK